MTLFSCLGRALPAPEIRLPEFISPDSQFSFEQDGLLNTQTATIKALFAHYTDQGLFRFFPTDISLLHQKPFVAIPSNFTGENLSVFKSVLTPTGELTFTIKRGAHQSLKGRVSISNLNNTLTANYELKINKKTEKGRSFVTRQTAMEQGKLIIMLSFPIASVRETQQVTFVTYPDFDRYI